MRCHARALALALALAMLVRASPVPAEDMPSEPRVEAEGRPSEADYDWHAGLNLRTDFGTHPIRIDGGIRLRALDIIMVLDPMFLLDSQHDLDLFVDGRLGGGWSTLLGWRTTSVGLADGRQWQHKSIVGMAARLPELISGHLRSQVGLELGILWVKQGGGLQTAAISFDSLRDVSDHFNFGMFVRFEYASAL